MVLAYPPAIFEEIMEFMVSSPTPEDIIAFKPSSQLEDRLTELLTKNKQDALTEDEQDELNAFLQIIHFMNMLRIRARQKIYILPSHKNQPSPKP